MTKTLHFLTRLGEDADLRRRFASDPARVLSQSGLNAGEQAVLAGADSAAVRSAAGVADLPPPPKIVTVPKSVLASAA